MEELTIDGDRGLVIIPSVTSSQRDFDFYVGKWKIRNRKLKERLKQCTEWSEFEADQEMRKILGGLGNRDNFLTTFNGEPFEGMTLRLFDPTTGLWSMYWADSSTGVLQPPTVGSFYGDVGRFFTRDSHEGQEIIVVFEWNKSDPAAPTWSQAFSTDEGQSWETNWYMNSRRADS